MLLFCEDLSYGTSNERLLYFFVLGLATMVWHMFIVKKLSSAAFLMDKVRMLMSVSSCDVNCCMVGHVSCMTFI